MSKNGISLESIVQRPTNGGSDLKTVILVTHATTEASVREAVEGMRGEGYLSGEPQVIRIERTTTN
jgi:homoserine dehydrogenase